jgi:DNA-binding winged helix-turn-helix (wHTH) protein/tetratricopeptide (TPR) repeat protein
VIYRFAGYELDGSAGELRRGGEAVAVQPKPLALLRLLIEERHRIVPNDELLERLWPEETVTPSSLSRAVSVARSAIGDGGRAGLIRSYTRRGYRFHGDVLELEDAPVRAAPGHLDVVPGEGTLPFVGRREALARLRSAWERATRGHDSVVVLSGPAGIGKTRLSEVFEREVEARGGLALRGRALEEEGEPAFWVWAQMLRRLLRDDPESLRVPGLAGSGELAALIPELARNDAGDAPQLPPEQQRFVLFDAVGRTLRSAAKKRPLLVIFEDLHWADLASLRLLEHVAFELSGAQILLLATVRAEPNEASIRTLSVLRRRERLESLPLGRLDADEVEALVAKLQGRPDRRLAQRLLERTDGVPLFLREACRRLEELGPQADPSRLEQELMLPGPDWVKDALSGLAEPCAQLVGAAAAIGREFALPVAADAAGIPRDAALDLLDDAVRAGVIEASPDQPARYRFVHDLYREAAYEALAPGARVRLHQRIARRLEERHGELAERVLGELAHHLHRALAVGDPERTYTCATRAAENAFRACAYERAAQHRTQALDALSHLDRADDARRLGTLIALGEAHGLAGERRQQRRILGEALDLARALDAPEAFAEAAILACQLSEWGVRDDFARAAVVEALERLDGPAPELQAKLLTRLGYLEAMFAPEAAERLLRQAVALARDLGAADPLEEALYALHLVLGGPDGHEERAAILDELRGAASASRDPVASVIAILDVACDRIEMGDLDGALRLRREAEKTAGDPPHPSTIWHRRVFDTGLALLEGRLDEVEGRVEEAAELGQRLQHPYAKACANGHRSHLCALRGEPEGLLSVLAPALGARQGPAHWVRARVARAQHALGRVDEARALYREALAEGPASIPRNLRWTATMVELAHACADLEDADGAAGLIAALAPVESHHAVMPMVVCYGGPAAWALARLHALCARPDDADDLYRDALAAAADLGARPTEAHIRLDHGRFLRRRGRRSAAREHLSAAAALAADLGMPALESAACRAMEG